MKATINHIGMAVPSITNFLAATDVLLGGLRRGSEIVNERQRVRELFLTDGRTVLELLEPMGDASPISSFLRRNPGGGLVHVALDVDALEPALALLEGVGGQTLVQPVPDVAFDERRIAFVLLAGQVVELIERPRSG
jgi:methylmalonyl-CoA/ethylmalonyl-CoA epimerase